MGVHPTGLEKYETREALLARIHAIEALVRKDRIVSRYMSQKWLAAVDLYNECRYDCKPARLAAA